MSVQYYDYEDKPIKTANYEEKPSRGFFKEEKYHMEGDNKTVNPDFELEYAKALRNDEICAVRMSCYPPLSDLADAIYWEKKGDDSKMSKYISDCDHVKSDHPLI